MAFMMSGLTEWSPEGKDFTFGAKTTSCLHPATSHDAPPTSHDDFELPDWMEARNNLGLANIDLFEDVKLSNFEDDVFTNDMEDVMLSSNVEGSMCLNNLKETLLPNNNEETMLPKNIREKFPSTLQDIEGCKSNSPQSLYTRPGLHAAEVPKITINLKRVKIPVATSKNTLVSTSIGYQFPTYKQNQSVIEEQSPIDANDLLDELARLVETQQIPDFTKFDTSMVEDNMQDLLSHLEVPEFKACPSETSSWNSEPASPFSLPSPVPSYGSLSPTPSVNESFSVPSPNGVEFGYCKTSQNANVSPWNSLDDTLQSPFSEDDANETKVMSPDQSFDTTPNDSQAELHSYSRSYKKKSNKSSIRASPYPEGKKERKKEQNKQAALRYRQKRKQEDDVILAQIEAEEERQKQLKLKFSNLKQELACMKKIMREVFIAKGVISADAFKKNI